MRLPLMGHPEARPVERLAERTDVRFGSKAVIAFEGNP